MIVASQLTKYYGTLPAILDLSFEIGEGEIVGFLGLNGAGKSTTLRIISCQLVPTAGTVTVGGYNVLDHSAEIRRRVGYLPEVPPLYHEMTVRSFLEFAAQLKGVPKGEVTRRVEEIEEITRTAAVSQQVIGTLSAGYRQRVGIAQAVVHKPALLILDEPFAGLDPVQTVDMREMIRGLGGEHTVLLSSHLLSQIHQTCDRILVIQKGRIVAQGTEDELVSSMHVKPEITMLVRGSEDDIGRAITERGIPGVLRTTFSTKKLDEGFAWVTVTVDPQEFQARSATDGEGGHLDASEALAAAVVEAGLGLREMKLKRSSDELEAAFIRLTRSALAEPAEKVASPEPKATPSEEETKVDEAGHDDKEATDEGDSETDEEAS